MVQFPNFPTSFIHIAMTSEINGFAVVDSVRASVVEEPPDKNENLMKVNDE